MAVSIKQFYALHNPDSTKEQRNDIIKVTDALRKEDIEAICLFLKDYGESYNDFVISLSACYLKFNNIPVTFKVKHFLSDILHRLRFNASLKNDTAITISKGVIDFIKNELKLIANWDGKTNLILLYHIKQIVLYSNGLMHDGRFKKLPWKTFVFYLQQYVRYFEVYDESHVFLMTYISLENLKLFVGLFLTVLKSITGKTKQPVKNILENNIESLNTLQDVYDKIRDLYILNRMKKYTVMWREQYHEDKNMFSFLRVLQVIGESIKDSPATPNLSKELKKIIIHEIGEKQVTTLKHIRNQISHIKSLPFVPVNQLYDKLYRQLDELENVFEKLLYIQKSRMSIEIRKKLEEDKVELPNGTFLRKSKNLLKNYNTSSVANKISHIDFSEFKIEESGFNLRDTMDYLFKTNNILGMEFILMIKVEDLKENEKRLNTNRGWMKDKCPTLSGIELRNHLAHGDPVAEMMTFDEVLEIRSNIKLLIEDMDSFNKGYIQKVTNVLEIEQQKIVIGNELKSLQQKQTTLDLIVEGELNQVEKQLQKVSPDWINWCNERGENVLQLASRNKRDNVQLIEIILKEKLELLASGNYTNMPLAIAIRKGNKNIAKFLLERHIIVLLTKNKIENYSDKFKILLKIYCEHHDKILTDKICFIFYCYCISIDSVESLNFALLQTYYLGFEQIFEKYDCTFMEIQQIYDAKLVANFFNYNEQIKEVEHINMIELLENTERNLLEIKRSRLKTGENALHVAINCDNIGMTETIYNNFSHLILLADSEQQTPFKVALYKNNTFKSKILHLVINDSMNKHELFINDLYILIAREADLGECVFCFIEDNLYSDNKMVQYWKLKLLNKIKTPYVKFKIFINDLKQIKETYSNEDQIMTEYLKLLVYCIFHKEMFEVKQKYSLFYFIIEMLGSNRISSQLLTLLNHEVNKIIKDYSSYGYNQINQLIYLKLLVELQTEVPEMLLFQIKLIHKYNIHISMVNIKHTLYALETVAKHSSFNDLDYHHYFIWVDVFIIITALNCNNEKTLEVQLEHLLIEWNVDDELKIKLIEMRSRNIKYLLIMGSKEEIIVSLKTKMYLWYQMQHYESVLQYVSLNRKISWKEMKCILEEYGENYNLREKQFFTFETKCIIDSCLLVGNDAIFKYLLEISICYYLISKHFVPKNEKKYPTLKDYNINNITELTDLLMTEHIDYNDLTCHILFYIVHSANVTTFAIIYNLKYGVITNKYAVRPLEIPPLHIACQCGALKIVEYLISTGVDLNSLDQFHRSPLHLAVYFKHDKIVQMLSKHGAADMYLYLQSNTEYIDTDNHNKLHKIIQSGNVEELEIYLSEDPDIEFKSSMETGNNCLHYAIQSQNVAMIKKVYSKCAHLTITTNYDNISPLDIAVDKDCDGNQSSRLLVVETLFNLILNDDPIRFAIIKEFLSKIVFEELALSRVFINSLLSKVMDLLISNSTDKTLHYWLMEPITDVIELYYKVGPIDDKLITSIIILLKHHVSKFCNNQILINTVVKLFTFIAPRSITHADYAEDLINLSEHILLKVENAITVQNIFISINNNVGVFGSTHKIFTNYAVYAMKTFPDNKTIQTTALEMIYIAYKNGAEPDLPVDIIRNSLRMADWDQVRTTLFAIYFVFRSGIERKNMDEVLDRELNLCDMIDHRDAIINLK